MEQFVFQILRSSCLFTKHAGETTPKTHLRDALLTDWVKLSAMSRGTLCRSAVYVSSLLNFC